MKTRIGKILPGKEVAVTGRHLDVFDGFDGDDEIDLLSGKITCPNGAHVLASWGLCPQSGETIVAEPKVIRIRQPEGVVMELQVDFLGRLRAQLEAKVMDIAPTEFVHQAILVVVRWKQVLKGLRVIVIGIVVSARVVVLKPDPRGPATILKGITT